MPIFPHGPNIVFPSFSDYNSFIYKYKLNIRRAVASHIDDPHYHEHIALWYNTSGEYDMYFNGETIRCFPGTLIFMPPFAAHAMDTKNVDLKKTEIISISFPRNALYNRKKPIYPLSYKEVICEKKRIPLCLCFSGAEKDEADRLFSDSLSEYNKKSDMHRTRIFENIDGITELLLRHSDKSISRTSLTSAKMRFESIAECVSTVFINYTSPPTVSCMAEKLGITVRGFSKLFRSITNTTYQDFSVAIRAMKAVNLLKFTNKSVSEIADECGYSNNSHLTRTFLKLFGAAPLKLRREMIADARRKESINPNSLYPHTWESHLDPETIKSHRLISLGKSDI